MKLYLAILKKNPAPEIDIEAFERYLPASPTKKKKLSRGNGKVQFFCWGINKDHKELISSIDHNLVVHDGIMIPVKKIDKDLVIDESWPAKSINESSEFIANGEFSIAWIKNSDFFCQTSLGGSHNIYIRETTSYVAVTNRSALLLGLPGETLNIDPESVSWKAFQGYVYGYGTLFSGVKKLKNGSKFHINIDSWISSISEPTFSDTIDENIYEQSRANPDRALFHMVDEVASYMEQAHLYSGAEGIDVPLSGGKDSRTILALLNHAGLKDKISKIWTRGTLYSPEVLSAQSLCESLNISNHYIARSPTFSKAKVSATTIVNSLNLHEGLLSLYDFCGIEKRNTFRFQGHELGLRAGRFSPFDTSSFENFFAQAIKSWSNPLNIHRNPQQLQIEIKKFFQDQLDGGAEVHDLGDCFSVFNRLPSWAAVMSNVDYYGGSISNPLISNFVVKFALSLPHELRRNETFPYSCLFRGAPELLKVPFAEQMWPESLQKKLAELRIEYIRTPHPFKSMSGFPNLKNPYIPNIKLNYFRELKPVVKDIIDRKRELFDPIFDVDKFHAIQDATDNPSFPYLYNSLAVYSAAIIAEYGKDIFDRSTKAEVASDLQERLNFYNGVKSDVNITEDAWMEALDRHELSIAQLVKEVQKLQEQLACTSTK